MSQLIMLVNFIYFHTNTFFNHFVFVYIFFADTDVVALLPTPDTTPTKPEKSDKETCSCQVTHGKFKLYSKLL